MRLKYEVFASALKAAYANLVLTSTLEEELGQQGTSVETNPLPLSVSYELIEKIKASFSNLGVDYEATPLPLSVAYEFGRFIINANYLDPVLVKDGTGTFDEFVLAYFKALTDSALAAELATKTFRKTLLESGYVSDETLFALLKTLVDLVGASDYSTVSLSKPLPVEPVIVSDPKYVYFDKLVPVQTLAITDASSLIQGKVLFDSSSATDDLLFFSGKHLANTQSVSDSDYAFTTTKRLFSDVFFTDDVDGAASLEDDQEMHFIKNTSNSSLVTDSLYRQVAYVRSLTDTSATSESTLFAFGKDLQEQFTPSDLISLNPGKVVLDHGYALDDISTSSGKTLSNTAAVLDSFLIYRNFFRSFDDVSALSDAKVLFIGRSVSDLTYIQDFAAISKGQGLYDLLGLTDSKLASLGKSSQDVAYAVESLFVESSKVNVDLASVYDTGSLRSQGYCDYDYFEEDYVGASRVF